MADERTRPARPPELASWRAGGAQIIPRPPGWALGSPAPWPPLGTSHRFGTESVLSAVAGLGAGKPPPWHVDDPRPSAVLICLFDGPAGAEVLLTRRSWHMRTHRGEVSFPGGRLDPGETAIEAALREAHEEVALDPRDVEVIGELDHLATMVSRSVIVPIVARLAGPPVVRAATSEVDRILTVPLAELIRADTYREEHWGAGEETRSLYFFELDDETVWGATGRMLRQLLDLALSG